MSNVRTNIALTIGSGIFVVVWVLLLAQQVYYYLGVVLSLALVWIGWPTIHALVVQKRAARTAMVAIAIMFAWIIVGSLISGEWDLQFYTRISYFLFNVTSAAGLAYFLNNHVCENAEKSCELILKAFFVYAVLNVIALLNRPFHDLSLIFYRLDELQEFLYEQQPYRFFGLAGFNGFGVALIYPLLIAVLLSSKLRNGWFAIVAVLLFTVVSVFGSRIAGMLSLGVALLLAPTRLRVLILAVLALALVYIVSVINDNETLKWAFEILFAYLNGEGLVTESSNVLFERMYFMPDDMSTILWGDFRFLNPDGSYYGHTDAGFMRMMLYFGVFGSVFYYLAFLGISLIVRFRLVAVMLLVMIIAEIKGDAILSSPASKFYFLIIFLFLAARLKKPQLPVTE